MLATEARETAVPDDWHSYYEARRLFAKSSLLELPLDTALLSRQVLDAVRACVAHAPCIEDRDLPNYEDYAIVLRSDEYSPAFSIIESVLFDEMVSWSYDHGPQRSFRLDWVAHADPLFSELSCEVSPDTTIQGESLFEHERAHLAVAQPEGLYQGYWILNFFRYRTAKKKQDVSMGYVQYHSWSTDYLAKIRMALAPRYPSGTDFETVEHTMSQMAEWARQGPRKDRHKRYEADRVITRVYLATRGEKQVFDDGRLITSELMIEKLLPTWMEARRHDIDFSRFAMP